MVYIHHIFDRIRRRDLVGDGSAPSVLDVGQGNIKGLSLASGIGSSDIPVSVPRVGLGASATPQPAYIDSSSPVIRLLWCHWASRSVDALLEAVAGCTQVVASVQFLQRFFYSFGLKFLDWIIFHLPVVVQRMTYQDDYWFFIREYLYISFS